MWSGLSHGEPTYPFDIQTGKIVKMTLRSRRNITPIYTTMSAATAPNDLGIAAQLPAGACYYLMHTLRGLLPLLLTDTPENRARRDEAAMARIAALHPADIAEAEVAALHVAHAEHAKACGADVAAHRRADLQP